MLAASLFLFSRLGVHATFWNLLPGDDPRRRRHVGGDAADHRRRDGIGAAATRPGVGSAVLNSVRQVGGSLGIAVLGAIVAAASRQAPSPRATIPALGPHERLPSRASSVGAVVALVGAVIAASRCRKRPHAPGARQRRALGRSRPDGRDDSAAEARGRRAAAGGARRGLRASSSARATAARRRPRSPARQASPSRSSTATSARSATSTSRAWPRPGGSSASLRGGARDEPEGCLGAIMDAYMAEHGGCGSSTSGCRR